MGYYEVPHTRNYDSDLGYLIKKYKELIKKYEDLNKNVTNLNKNIANIINDLVQRGLITLDAEYVAADEKIRFFVGGVQ